MKLVTIFALGAMAMAIVRTYGGYVEGQFFPVVVNAEVKRIEIIDPTSSRIWGEFDKVRDCQFEAIEFRVGEPGKSSRVDFAFEEGAKWRAQGRESFGPWAVQLTPRQVNERSFSIVYHKCHPFWITETVFYP